MIHLNQATVVRGQKTLLKSLSLAVEPNQFVAIIGPNGAGKSTLLKALSGSSLSSGQVHINGQACDELSAKELARQRAVLPQFDGLSAPLSVAETIEFGLLPFKALLSRAQQQQCIKQAIAAGQLATLLDRNYQNLSGGERARVRFTRLCTQLYAARLDPDFGSHPSFAFLDEPLAALDLRYQRLLMDAMRDLVNPKVGVVAVIHDLNWLVGHVDQVWVMVNGCLVANDRPEAILTNENLSRWFNTPLSVNAYSQPYNGAEQPRVAVHA